MKIFFYFLREYDELAFCRQFSKEYGIDFEYTCDYPTPENVHLAAGCDAVSVTPCDMSEPMVEAFAGVGVKYICCRSIGYDHVDLSCAKRLGIRVSHVFYPPNGVANFAIMLMMMCLRNAGQILKRADVQDYTLKGKIGRDLSNCTVGVIGTGKIGTEVIKHLKGFGCRLLANDIYENEEAGKIAEYVELPEMFRQADIITLHANATNENYHLLDAEAFAQMKDGTVIINTSRGKLIDSDALIDALESGRVGSAALDVLENESGLYYYDRVGDVIENRQMAVLRSFPNVLLTAHTAFYTDENVGYMVKYIFEAVDDFANGRDSVCEVK